MDFSELRERVQERYNISKVQLGELFEKTNELRQKATNWQKYEPFEKKRQIDEFLFTPDELPVFGKEYWFFLFTGLGKNHKDQLMISFGRNKNNTMSIDNHDQFIDSENYLGGIGEAWYFHNGVTSKLGKLGGEIRTDKESITFQTNEYLVQFEGTFPQYQVSLLKDKEKIINIHTVEPKIGDSMEFFSIDKFNMGVEVGNVYLDYNGTLETDEFQGRAYMQKVVMSAPFIPWYWGRFVFANGSVIVFFLLWVDLPGPDRIIYSQGKYFDVENKEYKVFNDFKIDKVKGTNYFILHHDSKQRNLFILMDSYTNNTFNMRSRGEFRYNEMFTEIKEIKIREGDKIYDANYFGKGSGSLEEATGMSF